MSNHAEDYAESVRDSIDEIRTAAMADAMIEDQDAREYLDEYPLEIVHQIGRRFEVVLTVGGPDARVMCDLDADGYRWGSAVLEVHWGSDVARRYGSGIDFLADYFAEFYVGM